MCKRLADILFPLNILGAKIKKCVSYDVKYVPSIDGHKDLNIVWSGERLIISWTEQYTPGGWGQTRYVQKQQVHTDGNNTPILISVIDAIGAKTANNAVYFNCTNVTYLEINGEQII